MRRLALAVLLSGLISVEARADEPVVTANGLRFQSGGPLTVDGGLVLALPTALGPGLSTGFGLGVIEGLTKVFFPEASNTVIFVIMAIVLLVRPAGLFGRRA